MGANKQRFLSLCQQLKDLLLISEGEKLTKLICDALRFLSSGDHSRQQDAQVVIQEVVSALESAVLETLSPKPMKKGKSTKNSKKEEDDAEIDDVTLNLQLERLCSFSDSMNITLFSESIDSDLLPKVCVCLLNRQFSFFFFSVIFSNIW
jgi:F420-0:gamma-glutamyl ligase